MLDCMCMSEDEIFDESKSAALRKWLRSKSAEEMQAAIDDTAVPMPASIKKQAKARINVLQEEAALGAGQAGHEGERAGAASGGALPGSQPAPP